MYQHTSLPFFLLTLIFVSGLAIGQDRTANPAMTNLLGSSVLEPNFEGSSSCITCHTRATVNNNTVGLSTSLGEFKSLTPFGGDVGAPDPDWFFQVQAGPPYRAAPLVYRVDFLLEPSTEPKSRAQWCKSHGTP